MSKDDEQHKDDDSAEESKDSGDSEKESGKEKGDGEEKNKDKPKPPSKKVLIIGGLVLLVLVIAGILYYLHARNFASTDDAYTTGHVHEISARVAGTVQTLEVEDNQRVDAGQTLVVLDQRDFLLALQKARAQLSQAEAQVAQQRANGERAEADARKAQNDYDRTTGLYQQDMKAVSKAEVDAVTAALKNAQGARASAKRS
ncbi:MAG: HlyD family secretion protein [Chthoniobacterales bacterium]